MRFVNWFRRAIPAAPQPVPARPGAPFMPEPPSGGFNILHRLLDDLGLPWREPRRQAEARTGRSQDPLYAREVLFFPQALRPPGFLQPWQAGVFEGYAPDMPVVRFTGSAWFTDDAAGNIQRLADHFAERLGPAPIRREWNTLACGWHAGAASLKLQSWSPAWQPDGLKNDAQTREPRLRTACHVTLLTGFRLPLSVEEEGWVAHFQPVAETRPVLHPAPGGLPGTAPRETEVEYARDPAGYLAEVQDRVGISPRREALILCTDQLFVVPAHDVLGFEVLRLLPAKGGGGSTLWVRCRTSCPTLGYKKLHVAQDSKPDGVTALGRQLAAMIGTSCEVGPYFDDV